MELQEIRSGQPEKRTGYTGVNFEQAISLTGYGCFHYCLVLTCGVCFLSASFQNSLNAYILPTARCDLQLSSGQMGSINAAFISGSILSAYFWGVLADFVGRKYVIAASLAADSIITLLSSLSQTFSVFITFRFLNGFISGAPASLIFAYLGEFHSSRHSKKSICYVGFFWNLALMLLPGIAWIVIPQPWNYQFAGFKYNSWRIFIALFAIPNMLSAILLLRFPESPKFLMALGRYHEVLHILSKIYESNTGKQPQEYPVKSLQMHLESSIHNSVSNNTQMTGKSLTRLWKAMWSQTCALFKIPVLYNTVLCSMLLFANMFGYYGLGLWLPELFNRFEEHYKLYPTESVSVCELQQMDIIQTFQNSFKFYNSTEHILKVDNITSDDFSQINSSITSLSSKSLLQASNQSSSSLTTSAEPNNNKCAKNSINTQVFLNTLLVGAACLLGNIISGVLAGRVESRILSVVTMLMAGSCAVAIYFLRSSTQNLIVSCLFLSSIGTANFVITSVVVDLFPTKIRAMAICTSILAGRIGAVASNIVFGELIDINCEVPVFLLGTVCIAGGFLSFFIPKTPMKIIT